MRTRATRRDRRAFVAALAAAAGVAIAPAIVSGRELRFGPVEDARDPVLLVASPTMRDADFVRTVVAVGFPPDVGPMGVILNRAAGASLGQVLGPSRPELASRADPVWLGGPVAQDGFVFVFRAAEHPVIALPMGDDCFLSGDGTLFARVVAEPDGGAHRFFMGFAQWAEGQLDAEIARGDWWVLPMDTRVLFDTSTPDLWRALIERVRNPSAARPGKAAEPRRAHHVTPPAPPSPASAG